MIAAQILNAQRTDRNDRVWEPADFFPRLAAKDGEAAAPVEMTTEQSVTYLKTGFGLFVPAEYRERVGL